MGAPSTGRKTFGKRSLRIRIIIRPSWSREVSRGASSFFEGCSTEASCGFSSDVLERDLSCCVASCFWQ